MNRRPHRPRARRCRGVTTLEFAMVLPWFVLLLWGLIAYTLVFAAQHTMIQATAEGARAALRYGTMAEREATACRVAQAGVTWIAGVTGAAPTCQVTTDCANVPCRRVRLTYEYATRPMVPALPLMARLMPTRLTSEAVVHMNP